MARKDDILSIYTKEVEGIKEAGLFKGEAPFVSPQGARVKMEDGRELLCMCANNYLGLGDNPRLIEAAKRTYDEKGYGWLGVGVVPKGYSNFTDTFNDLRNRMGGNLTEFTYVGSIKSEGKSGDYGGVKYETIYTITATTDIAEGWYWLRDGDSGVNKGRQIIYLQAANNAETNTDGKRIAVKKDAKIYIYSYHYKCLLYCYEQAQYNESESFDASTQRVTNYTINRHQYNDYIIYGVDWNSWYKATQDGLLNKVIGGLSNLFTHRTDINQITATNADQVLGLKGQYTVDNISRSLRSYNLAWIVYSPKRSTWYYLPDSSTRISSALSGVSWISNKNTPVPLDITGWSSSTAMVKDIETRKLSSRGFFNLIDTTEDKIWVPLPTGSTIDRTSLTE